MLKAFTFTYMEDRKTKREQINRIKKILLFEAAKAGAAPSAFAVSKEAFLLIALEEAAKCKSSRDAIINRLINLSNEEQR